MSNQETKDTNMEGLMALYSGATKASTQDRPIPKPRGRPRKPEPPPRKEPTNKWWLDECKFITRMRILEVLYAGHNKIGPIALKSRRTPQACRQHLKEMRSYKLDYVRKVENSGFFATYRITNKGREYYEREREKYYHLQDSPEHKGKI